MFEFRTWEGMEEGNIRPYEWFRQGEGDVGKERGAGEEQRVATTTGLRAGLAG